MPANVEGKAGRAFVVAAIDPVLVADVNRVYEAGTRQDRHNGTLSVLRQLVDRESNDDAANVDETRHVGIIRV